MKRRNISRLASLGAVALTLASGCGVPGNAPRRPAPEDEVSVGYGTRSRKAIAGSVSSVSAERVGGESISRIERLLERVPGLRVIPLARGDFTVRIRRMGNAPGSAEPLLVIDGALVMAGSVGSTLALIPPQDIVRIDVLKDAVGTAMYGIRGANGVIIVTTRRGR